ncbi:CAP domain-containing protein [Nonomuraea rubra]
MRRELQAMACVGCLTALSLPAPAASAQQAADRQACRVLAPKPSAGHGTVRARPVKPSCARPAASRGFASAAETAVVTLTNRARAANGCRPLTHDSRLHRAATRHSADMARGNYFSHTSRDGRTFGQRIKATGFAYRRAGENIAKGQATASAVVKGWLDSPGHRANMLDCAFTHIGVGHHARGPHWTQDFASR